MPKVTEIANNKSGSKRLAAGWFSFTCCEDSTILFTELLNKHFDAWTKLVDFKYFTQIKSNNSMENLDVAFVEGAISSPDQEAEVKKVRENAKYIVAIGSCACTGMPSATRNTLTDEQLQNEKIKWSMENFNYNEKVRKLDEVIKVDDWVDGCPMAVPVFMEILMKYLKLFEIVKE